MNILQKILFFVFLLFFSLPVLGQDIHIENGWNFASGSAFYFSWIDSSLTKNFIVEDEFGNHQQEFWQYGGTFVDNGFYYISVGWLKDVDNFIVPDSIVVYLKTGEISNTTDRILMTMGLQYGDHNWSWLGDQQKEITPLWERYCFDMTWVKTFMDSVSIVYMYFTFMTEEGVDSCYIGGGLLGDDLLGKNGNTFFLIDGFGDDTITRVEVPETKQIPSEFVLEQNYPNPFNPATIIKYEIPAETHVSLKVYDILGNEVANLVDETKSVGSYSAMFDAADLAGGVYIYRLSTGNFVETKKMILLK